MRKYSKSSELLFVALCLTLVAAILLFTPSVKIGAVLMVLSVLCLIVDIVLFILNKNRQGIAIIGSALASNTCSCISQCEDDAAVKVQVAC